MRLWPPLVASSYFSETVLVIDISLSASLSLCLSFSLARSLSLRRLSLYFSRFLSRSLSLSLLLSRSLSIYTYTHTHIYTRLYVLHVTYMHYTLVYKYIHDVYIYFVCLFLRKLEATRLWWIRSVQFWCTLTDIPTQHLREYVHMCGNACNH